MIRRLGAEDLVEFHGARLAHLRSSPDSVASGAGDWAAAPDEKVLAMLAPRPDGAVFGALSPGLVGIGGISRQVKENLRHKATLWGLYVTPDRRREGTGQRLGRALIAYARDELGLTALRAMINAGDPAPIALFQSLGFTVYGTEPRALLVDGIYHDQVYLYLPLT
jgi:RimJ/RimL family protein N-acetyltransferase